MHQPEIGGDVFHSKAAEIAGGSNSKWAWTSSSASSLVTACHTFFPQTFQVAFLCLAKDHGPGHVLLRPVEQGKQERILEAVPELITGCQRVRQGMQGEHAQVLFGLDLGGEVANDVGVVEVSPLGDLGHQEMVLDEPDERIRHSLIQVEAAGNVGGKAGTAAGVVGFATCFAGIVEEEGEVEEEGAIQLLEEGGIGGAGRGLGFPDAVELLEAHEGVLVGGVLVVELVLDQAGELAEFGEVFAEQVRPRAWRGGRGRRCRAGRGWRERCRGRARRTGRPGPRGRAGCG